MSPSPLRVAAAFALLFAACATSRPQTPIDAARALLQGWNERAGLVLPDEGYGDGATKLVYLDQGWEPFETLWFYHADQGSMLMPYDVFVHMEQASSDKPFIAPENLSRYRVLNQRRTPNNPDALPVGFARHDDQLGLTCAACHSAQVIYKGTAVRVDGGPTMANVNQLFIDADAALAATLADEAKLRRLATAIAGHPASDAELAGTKKRVEGAHEWFTDYIASNRSDTVEGFARLDAVGRIINQVVRFTSGSKNSLPPNAPSSYPLIWDAPRHDYVQWPAFAPNEGPGSVGRNTGEVIGVFGHVEVKHYTTESEAKKGFPNSIQADALVDMEETLRKLQSPAWPEQVLPPIDRALAEKGARIYEANCISCHALINRSDPDRHVTAMVTGVDVVGTDDTEVHNFTTARIPTGVLQGAVSLNGDLFGADAPAVDMLGAVGAGVLNTHKVAVIRAIANAKAHHVTSGTKQGNYTPSTNQDPMAQYRAYKARPLNGAWASAPYLHNGSVPSLYDLLLPSSQRPAKFVLGRWEFDPRKVGFVYEGTTPWVLDTSVKGNSNKGHEYGTSLSDEDRWALVEYLKTL